MTQEQKSGDNSANFQVGNNLYKGKVINVTEKDGKEKTESILNFISNDVMPPLTFIIVGIIALLTNPSAEIHVNKIQRGAFSNYQLDRDFYYESYFIFSRVYVIGDKKQQINFSYGIFGQVVETSDYNYNQARHNNKL